MSFAGRPGAAAWTVCFNLTVTDQNPTDMQPADASARRTALAAILIAALAGTVLLLWIQKNEAAIQAWAIDALPAAADQPGVLLALSVASMLPLIVLCAYLFRVGRKITDAERFPPPGTKVVRETRIVRGAAAVRRGWALQALAAFMVLASLAFSVMLWWVLLELARGLAAA